MRALQNNSGVSAGVLPSGQCRTPERLPPPQTTEREGASPRASAAVAAEADLMLKSVVKLDVTLR